MKSYWIAATVFLLTAWPLCSKAYVVSGDQSRAEDKPVQASSNSAANAQAKPEQPSSSVPATPAAAPQNQGSYMLVELSRTLKAKNLKPGEKINAEIAQDVIAHGKIIIPMETKLVGHVTEVSARDSKNSESRLGIVFDRIVLKHYHDVNMQAVVQAVAPAVVKRSRVDQPSQMLPPSMMGVGPRDPGPLQTSGRSSSSRSSGTSTLAGAAPMQSPYGMPITVKQSPSNHVESAAAQLDPAGSGGKPLSIGMPQGVTGLKGLSLSSSTSGETPGPVIVSNTDNVKLESGTQILLHVLRVEPPATADKAK